jgi:hypothetical protein
LTAPAPVTDNPAMGNACFDRSPVVNAPFRAAAARDRGSRRVADAYA